MFNGDNNMSKILHHFKIWSDTEEGVLEITSKDHDFDWVQAGLDHFDFEKTGTENLNVDHKIEEVK
jgi:hypothetical protein